MRLFIDSHFIAFWRSTKFASYTYTIFTHSSDGPIFQDKVILPLTLFCLCIFKSGCRNNTDSQYLLDNKKNALGKPWHMNHKCTVIIEMSVLAQKYGVKIQFSQDRKLLTQWNCIKMAAPCFCVYDVNNSNSCNRFFAIVSNFRVYACTISSLGTHILDYSQTTRMHQ